MNIKTIGWTICCLAALSSCVKDDLDACPPQGSVSVKVYAEKFQRSAPYGAGDLEPDFGARITNLEWYLYRGESFYERGTLDIQARTADSAAVFARNGLPYGEYRLVLAGNRPQAYTYGSPEKPESYGMTYPGPEWTVDYFTAAVPLTVDGDSTKQFTAVMERVHGAVRLLLENIPARAGQVEIGLDNLAGQVSVLGVYTGPLSVKKRIPAADAGSPQGTVLGTLPTMGDAGTAWSVALYEAESEVPFYERRVTDGLRIERNRLLELKADLGAAPDGDIVFTVTVDPAWDGAADGGSSDI